MIIREGSPQANSYTYPNASKARYTALLKSYTYFYDL